MSFNAVPFGRRRRRSCKMSGADEVNSIVSGKLALKYVGDEVDAIKEIAEASHERPWLRNIRLKSHLKSIYDNLLEQTESGPRGTAHESLQGAEMQDIAGPNAVAPRCNYAPAKFSVFP